MRGQLARLIRARRVQLTMTQQQVSDRLRVARATYAEWERGAVAVPETRVEALAEALNLPAEQARHRWEDDSMVLYSPHRRKRLRPLPAYPVRGTLAEMLKLTPLADELRNQAHAAGLLTPRLERELLEAFPRDCADELLALYHLVVARATLEFRAPLAEGCRRLVVEPGTRRYAGDRLTHVLRLATPKGDVLLFPQVALATENDVYRVDFLLRYKSIWAHLEIDDPGHRLRPHLDSKRTSYLRMKRFTYDVAMVRSAHFVRSLLADLEAYVAARRRRRPRHPRVAPDTSSES